MLRRLLSPRLIIPLGILAFIFGAKLALIHTYASDQPFHDQWNAEGGGVFRWRLRGEWQFEHTFYPQGEHTPALTRIALTGLAAVNAEQWDSRLAMLLSVGALALAGLVFWQIAQATLASRWPPLAAAAIAVLLAMPCNYENYLWGFQTQFVFLILFSVAHLWGTLREERLGASWWLAQVCGFVALFTIASGVMSAVVLAGCAGLAVLRAPRSPWGWATLVVNVALVTAGVWLLRHTGFSAGSSAGAGWKFVSALGHLLSWPLPGPWWVLLIHAPGLALLWRARLGWPDGAVRVWLAVLLWCWALAAAFAYGRGTGEGEIAVRYQDHLTLGLIANVCCALCLLGARPSRRAGWLAAAWLALLLAGLGYANRPGQLLGNLSWYPDFFARQRAVLTDYLATNDAAILERDPEVRMYLMHFAATRDVLADGMVRLALPISLAPTLAVQGDPASSAPGAGFRPDRRERQPNGARVLTLHGGAAGARFVSAPIVDDLRPVWRLRVSGRVGPDAATLRLRDAAGREIAPLDASFDATGRWKTVSFLRGSGPVRLEAQVPPGAELRLTEPIELGWGTWLLPKFSPWWSALLGVGTVLLAWGGWRAAQSARASVTD